MKKRRMMDVGYGPDVQMKLLRVLEKGNFERLGSNKTIKVDVRIIAATNRKIMKQTGWRVRGKAGAAELLGLKPTALDARMKKLGIVRPK